MLPSSSSQIARYGHINHYKKFWLLQTQLEKQEQGSPSSCSSTLSLQGNPSVTGAGHTACMRESSSSSKSSSLLTHHGSGDFHTLIAPQIGICRMDASTAGNNGATCNSSRVMGAVHTSMNFEAPYLSAHSYLNLRAPQTSSAQPDTNFMRDVIDRPRLSLAVHLENSVDAVKTSSGLSTAMSSQLQPLTPCDVADSTNSVNESFRKKDKEALRCRVEAQAQYTISGCKGSSEQPHLSASFCNRPESFPSSLKSSPSAIVVNPRTCTLCGTSRTPLWRSGPNGPKSLCNACGIRVKKTKRLEAALHVSRASSSPPSLMAQIKGSLKAKHSSEFPKEAAFRKKKKFLIGVQGKTFGKYWPSETAKLALLQDEKGKVCANALAEDVEQAAVLLMALSCGLVLS